MSVFADMIKMFTEIYESGDENLFSHVANAIIFTHERAFKYHAESPCHKQTVNSCKVIPLKQKRKSRA